MADNPFDQTNYGLRERPVSADWNQLSSQLYQTIREVHRFQHDARVSSSSSTAQSVSGFHGAGLRVVPSSSPGMSVVVSAGLGFLFAPTDVPTDLGATDLESVDDRSPYKPLIVQTPQTFNTPVAPSAPNSRIDIVEVRNPRRLENAIPRRQLDPNTLTYDDHVFFKTMAFQIDNLQCGTVNDPSPSTAPLSYKVGTAGNPGLVPPTTPGYLKIAEVLVGNTTTSVLGANVVDRRSILSMGGVSRGNIRFQLQWNAGAPIVNVLSVSSPPGIDLAVAANVNGSIGGYTVPKKGFAALHAFGGQITGASVTVTGHSLVGTTPPVVWVSEVGSTVSGIPTGGGIVTNYAQFGASAFVPPAAIGTGQKAALALIQCYELTNTGPNATTTAVEDVIIDASFQLTYW